MNSCRNIVFSLLVTFLALALICVASPAFAAQTPNTISTIVGGGSVQGMNATAADVPGPTSVVKDAAGELFVAAPYSRDVFKVSTSEGARQFEDSSLYRLYRAGLVELNKRDAGRDGRLLSGASLDAVKAAVDADSVREGYRLNAQMVLLTIAISGGPFLGLLGTVIGVMITFASIAAAGDVNVNAIAPGIAAALLATVAGLSVAIPSLFGYNYLASRIKTITSDMQIFIDEFVTRVAELYGAR